jgi:hypothetical protein
MEAGVWGLRPPATHLREEVKIKISYSNGTLPTPAGIWMLCITGLVSTISS